MPDSVCAIGCIGYPNICYYMIEIRSCFVSLAIESRRDGLIHDKLVQVLRRLVERVVELLLDLEDATAANF